MTQKKDLGQFFTTNSNYILSGFEEAVRGKIVMDPFAGGGDLLRWAERNGAAATSGYDIDPNLISDEIQLNDSLKNIPYVPFNITNPPWLAKNKMTPKMKESYPMDEYEDMYLLSIKKIMESGTDEGIIIVPVNFFSAENSDALRLEFMVNYQITKINYFREQVFADTTYNAVAFHYKKSPSLIDEQTLHFTFFPDKQKKAFKVERRFQFRIAGRELSAFLGKKAVKTIRLTEDWLKHREHGRRISGFYNDKSPKNIKRYEVSPERHELIKKNIILLNCIDTNASEKGWIKAEDVRTLQQDCLVGKNTSRNIAHILLPDIPLKYQERIIPLFNEKLNQLRRDYDSLFLTNFRDNDRKRVSFEFCYKLITHCYEELKASDRSS